jgi:tRNA-splicing ligase RtcB
MCGTKEAEGKSFGSNAHGAGRVKSRTQVRKEISFEEAKVAMEGRGIFVKSRSHKGMVEESPDSYKDVEEVVRASEGAGLGGKVARLEPLLVVIG